MKKETKMVQLSKEKVEKRRILVKEACEGMVKEGIKITYKEVENRTNISKRTLEREPYRTDISIFRDSASKNKYESEEVELLKSKVSHLEMIIKQLYKENHNLKTKLYENNII